MVVYEGEPAFDIRALLADHIAWRRAQGATTRDCQFAWPDGVRPKFRNVLDGVLRDAGVLTDPMIGEKRVAYSFRHYFASRLIELGLSVAQIAEWFGTSSQMIERHNNRFPAARDAHLLNGAKLRLRQRMRDMPPALDAWETDRDALDVAP